MLSDDRIHGSPQICVLLLRARRFLSVDFELHAAVGETAFEEVAVEFGVEFEDAARCDGAEEDHRTMRLVSSK